MACTATRHQVTLSRTAASSWDWQLPPGFLPPPVPDSNPMTMDKVELGRRLFYDNRLSVNGQGSCASCHQQRLAFTDGRAKAIGATGEQHSRSSMSLVNVAYNATYTWASREVRTLEQQIPIPLFNVRPIELGLLGLEARVVDELRSDPGYALLFDDAFPNSADAIVIENVVKALATFLRTIISADSSFDRRVFLDDQSAMTESSVRGMQLFFSDELQCGTCHGGRTLGGGQDANHPSQSGAVFHNTGLYNVADASRYPDVDNGLRMESGDPDDDGKFRAPTLRNIALTAPYMHDGSIATLSEVIDHYAAGGRSIRSGRFAGDGSVNSLKSPFIGEFELSDADRQALLNFLDSLTDDSVLVDSRFAAPSGLPNTVP